MEPLKLVEKIEIWPIARLIAYAKNPRIHSKTQIAQIKASIRRDGMLNPILVDRQGNVIAGHGRIMAGQELGLTHLPVIVSIILQRSKSGNSVSLTTASPSTVAGMLDAK